MERFENDDLQYVVDDYDDFDDFNNDGPVVEPEPQRDTAGLESFDSDFEDDIELVMVFKKNLSNFAWLSRFRL